MLALGSSQASIEAQIDEGKVNFDIANFLNNVVLADMNSPVHPFLLGRCLWVASKFPKYQSTETMTAFLEGTVRGLAADQPHPVRISAVRAIWGFCEYLKAAAGGGVNGAAAGGGNMSLASLLVPLLPALVDGLVNMAANFSQSSEILGLILENLAVVLDCDPKFTASQEAKVSPLAIAIFLKYSSDPVIIGLSQDLFKILSKNPECAMPLQNRLIPTVVSILNSQDQFTGMKSVAMDVLETLIRSSHLPLSDHLIQEYQHVLIILILEILVTKSVFMSA